MRNRLRSLLLVSGLGLLASLVSPPSVQAGLMLIVSDQSGHSQTINGTGTPGNYNVSYTGTVGNFAVNLMGTSNSPGTSRIGQIQNIDTSATNNGTGTERLTIMIFSDGFMSPGIKGSTEFLRSSITSTDYEDAQPLAYMSYLQQGAATTSSGYQVFVPNSPGDTVSSSFVRSSSSYNLISRIFLTLGSGGSAEVTGSTAVGPTSIGTSTTMMATPEPTTMVALLSGLPVLAIGAFRRHRRAR